MGHSPVSRIPSLLWDDQSPQEGQRILSLCTSFETYKHINVGSPHHVMSISENTYSVITCWDLKCAEYQRKWSGYLRCSKLLCLMTVLLSVGLHKHLSQFPSSAHIFSHSVRVPWQLWFVSQPSPSGAFFPVGKHWELMGKSWWLSRLTASESLKVEGDGEIEVLSSQALTLRPPFWLVTCRVEGKLDRGLWRTPLTVACAQYHQIALHIRPVWCSRNGTLILGLEQGRLRLRLSICPFEYMLSVMC